MFSRYFRVGSKQKQSRALKVATTATVAASAIGGTAYLFAGAVAASDAVHPPAHPWNHLKPWQGLDHGSIRRGFQVYQQVCSTCHSLDRIAWRNLVGELYTEEEVKAMAEDAEYQDGPDEEGEMFDRPGKLSDYLPRPYPNDEAARFANNNALPPDLSLIVKAREYHEDYVFSLLTGYTEPPVNVSVGEGLNYNPYFAGGQIAMAAPLNNDVADGFEYDDGTEASVSQMAKDVSTFLLWASSPETDERKRSGIKAFLVLGSAAATAFYFKKVKFSTLKTRVVSFRDIPK